MLTGLNVPNPPVSPPLSPADELEREILEETQTQIINLQVRLEVHHLIFDGLFSEREMAEWEKGNPVDMLDSMNRIITKRLKELR